MKEMPTSFRRVFRSFYSPKIQGVEDYKGDGGNGRKGDGGNGRKGDGEKGGRI